MTEVRGVGGTSPTVEELSHFVLVIRESYAGEVTHQFLNSAEAPAGPALLARMPCE